MPDKVITWTSPGECSCCGAAPTCPAGDKLLLPILTENTGDWFADCASAASTISSNTSNCVGYINGIFFFSTFTATDGGTSLTLVQTLSLALAISGNLWGSVNAEVGETLSIAFSASAWTPQASADIYDDTGTIVESLGASTSSPLVSSALPYTGRYTVRVSMTDAASPPDQAGSLTAIITSSGTMSVNQIQALYDVGGDDPACLNCGDSCP